MVAVLLLAVTLRLHDSEGIAVEHFDEGVYASNIWFGPDRGNEYPGRHLFAPPLFPWLVQQASLFGVIWTGTPQAGAIAVNLAAGVLTVLVLWWVCRCWFTPAAGVAAAVLAATSGFHLLFSRVVLTDCLLGLLLLAAVGVLPIALHSGRLKAIATAGLLTGLAWCVKYNGWLPLAIGSAGLAAWQCEQWLCSLRETTERPAVKQLVQPWGRWLMVAGVAVLVWSPVWWGLRDRGGYAAVAANHRQYLVGPGGWWDSFLRQAAAHDLVSGRPDAIGMGLALLLAGLLWFDRRTGAATRDSRSRDDMRLPGGLPGWLPLMAGAIWLAILAAVSGGGATAGLVAVVSLGWQLVAGRASRQAGAETSAETGEVTGAGVPGSAGRLRFWLLAAWFTGLLLVTPLYRPYSRLTLPWLLAAWVAAGPAIAAVAGRLRDSLKDAEAEQTGGKETGSKEEATKPAVSAPAQRLRFRPPAVYTMLLLAGLPLLYTQWTTHLAERLVAWRPRTAFQELSADVLRDAAVDRLKLPAAGDAPVQLAVYVIGEPGLFYQMAARGPERRALVHPLGSLDFAAPDAQRLPLPLYAVLGPHALRDPAVLRQLDDYAPRLEPVGEFAYRPSYLVQLDNLPASNVGGKDPPETVRLFRVLNQPRP